MPAPLPYGSILPVAGVSYRQDDVRTCRPDQPIRLIHDPSNPYDTDAVAVVTVDGRLLGYVPSALTGRLHACGVSCFDATIVEVLRRDTWGLRVRVDGPSDDADATRPAPAAAAADRGPSDPPDAGDAVEVTSPSGRRLGTLVADHGREVTVDRDGRHVRYPKSAVRFAA